MKKRRKSGLRRLVNEYCHAPQEATGQTFHIDHIVPQSQGGHSSLENLALACPHCNLTRGGRGPVVNPRTSRTVALFNPRHDDWDSHFRWSQNRLRLIGRTATGRATIQALKLNDAEQVEARVWWYLMGLIP